MAPSNAPGPAHADGSYRTEVIRKLIHLASVAIPIYYFFTPRDVALELCVPVTLLVLAIDIGRHFYPPLETLFNRLFGWLLRRHETDRERKRLNGATWVLISATLAIWLFPKIIAITGFCVLIIADTTAALVGRRFGHHRFLSKSVEGSAAFFASALVVVALLPKVEYSTGEYVIGAAAALVATVLEALPVDLDDNFLVPIGYSAALWALYLLLYPAMNVYRFG
jgi:dolichol kinase